MRKILWLILIVIVFLAVLAFLWFVWPGPQIANTVNMLSEIKNQAAVAGPQGPAGPAGPQGPAGPAGPQGPAGQNQVSAVTVPAATAEPAVQPAVQPAGAQVIVGSSQSNDWTLTWLAGADFDRGDGTTFRQDAEKWTWRAIAPELWPTFPNEPNPLVPEFPVVTCADDPTKQCVPDGLEYANPESNFCQQLAGEACRVPVASESYLYYSGDYDIPGVGSCSENGTGIGCILVVINVGKVTSDYTGIFNQGFRLHGRYFNGNALDMAIWGLTSEGTNKMLNMNSKLNPTGIQNAGANCSVPEGCKGVHIQVLFTSGNEPLMGLETTFTR
ncbi:hypothetical protein A2394_02445 [Candidatus Woesebacteria bacterium RIFOXYB1_FULL_42_36]|uniref:Collagen-like protein n=1 Tax=Candidatus Woesebacteria bacterium RIFOXYD1_FULL_43_18 TaxID=1802551 RepID=A0A1F8DIH6_9BACT|nr:MAG: hypothetical protein A2394_02445 [Candidatus Woesebacteria bacterium RIFOXYB1_FULL_42_36]OGM87698.1 MAG: hypothetical protein A2573_00305 [Candidatus Woesebacteria bacterium RIFOXYD1_FULL_43_18]